MNSFLPQLINILANVLYIALIGRVIMSWFNIGPSSPIYPIANVAYRLTEPILAPIRRILPTFGMLDFSPMAAIFLIWGVRWLLITLVT